MKNSHFSHFPAKERKKTVIFPENRNYDLILYLYVVGK